MDSRSILIAIVIIVVFYLIWFTRMHVAYTNHIKMIDAICWYRCNCIENGIKSMVDYDDMESMILTIARIWDFDCKNILPLDKYQYIKPYIGN